MYNYKTYQVILFSLLSILIFVAFIGFARNQIHELECPAVPEDSTAMILFSRTPIDSDVFLSSF